MRSKFKWIFTLLLAFSMQFSFAQDKTVSGTITDGKLPLPGANVVIKGTTKGVSADMDGKYAIKAKAGDVLEFSFQGYEKKTVTVGAASSYNVSLKEVAKTIEEVVVTSIGIKKSRNQISSAQQNVGNKELTQAANPNVVQSLAGKVTGLQINTTSNGANASTSIVLRGNRTLTGNNQALVVIDNAISSADILKQLPPEIIESVNVIKGAQGAALYGEQGSNGVLIVTTKRGAKSKMEVTVNSSIDFQKISFLPKRQTKYGQGWVDTSYDFGFNNPSDPRNGYSSWSPYENGAWGPAFSDPNWAGTMVPVGLPQADGTILMSKWESRGSDNIKDFFKTGMITQNSVTVNAGNEEGYVMGTYSRQTSDFVVDRDGMKRNVVMLKAGKKAGKWKIDGSATYINQSTSETDSNLLYELLQTPTNIDVNMFKDSGTAHHWTVYAQNPWQIIKQKRYNSNSNSFNGNFRLDYELNKNLSLTNTTNIQMVSSTNDSHNDGFNENAFYDYSSLLTGTNTGTYQDFGGADQYSLSSYYISTNMMRKVYDDILLNMNYDLTSKINFKANFGANVQDTYYSYTQQGGTNLKIAGWYNIQNVQNPDRITSLSNGYNQTRKVAAFANMDFDYNKYLFLNLTDRIEQTSTIVGKTFNYYSAGLSFIPTIAFNSIKGDVLNYAKLYINFSKVGNSSSVGQYAATNVAYGASGYPYTSGGLLSYTPRTALVDPNIKPEFVFSKEIGGQFSLFKDRVSIDGSYYINDTKDLITNATTSYAPYSSTLLSNTGKLQNKGYEFGIGFVPFKSDKGFNWNVRAGLTHYKTVVKELSNGTTDLNLLLDSSGGVGLYASVGEQFPTIKATQFATDADGHVIVGANGIPQVTSTLQTVGKATPDYIINLSNTFSYKGLSLTAVADYRANYSMYSDTYNSMLFAGFTLDSAEFDRSQGYTVPNSVVNSSLPSTPVYVTNTTPVGGAAATDSRGLATYYTQLSRIGQYSIVDASAIKIREISLSYSLPSSMLKNTGINSLKFGVNARNPFIIFIHNGDQYGRKNQGYTDPEASYLNTVPGYSNVGQYPTTKTYGFSLNVTF
ncbi:SusC/RagA family TonB-linked outer membrane protein [Flavobacterium aciduliphilum]|uniref:TonB-linked SusC/RagA family outer membrane protein n=1 Tax=Flavobacterium aciduliphilum TaxID=1101402 RepID=A0A328Y6L7_9FLAO|nr:SusC/RagA family TonB-linked outer membrane protein [Flavobacterium aciduliphilum]RAR69312.1 TonB-linked SusC/RagA family outer membrane protein [Flavobacterium aciduliphilum]